MKKLPAIVVLGLSLLCVAWGQKPQPNLAILITGSEAVAVVEVLSTDYSRTPADGPMTAEARVLKSVKGVLKKDQTFRFSETAWVGPGYRTGEVRILFLEPDGSNSWRVLSNLYAKADFFIERDAIPELTTRSLMNALEKLPAPARQDIRITRDMLQ